MTIEFTLNGDPETIIAEAGDSALEHLSLPNTGEGRCLDGGCMRCSIVVSGRVFPACNTPAYRLHNTEVYTVDGLENDRLYQNIRRAFQKVGLDRCRESWTAMVLLAYQILTEIENPTETEIQRYSRYFETRCAARDEFDRAVRLAGHLHYGRRRHGRERR